MTQEELNIKISELRDERERRLKLVESFQKLEAESKQTKALKSEGTA